MPRPELILRRTKPACKLSIILLDWGVRESFHSLHYLNQQKAPRESYELIWLEFYEHQPAKLREMVFRDGSPTLPSPLGGEGLGVRGPLLEQWLVAGYPREYIFNKHRLYNLGFLLAQGEYCVICDSDAIFTPNFVAKMLDAFARAPNSVVHLDEIRNNDPRLFPFCYPSIPVVLGPGCVN